MYFKLLSLFLQAFKKFESIYKAAEEQRKKLKSEVSSTSGQKGKVSFAAVA